MMIAVGLALILGWNGLGGYDQVIVGLEIMPASLILFQAEAGYLTPGSVCLFINCFAAWRNRILQRIFASAGPKR